MPELEPVDDIDQAALDFVFKLAFDICLTLDHPWTVRFPVLAECPDLDAVYQELWRILLADSA